MAKMSAKTPKLDAAPRVGRPPRELAGEVDDRILEAARRAFLDHGFAGASIGEIARLARAGKPTIYARFPSKEALFAAVAVRDTARVRSGFENQASVGATIEERLCSAARSILRCVLTSEAIDLMRMSIAEVRKYPNLADVGRMMREHSIQAIAQVLMGVTRSDAIGSSPAFAPDRIASTTHFFVDLVVSRLMMRGVFGENLDELRAEIEPHVGRSLPFFVAACRGGLA